MIAFKAKSWGLSVARARLAGTPSRIPTAGHDDVANAVAGAAALSKFGGCDTSMRWELTTKTKKLLGPGSACRASVAVSTTVPLSFVSIAQPLQPFILRSVRELTEARP